MRRLTLALAAYLLASPVGAATLDGVSMPDRVTAAERPLVLNGMATRHYSLLRVRVYVAGLYLEAASQDAAAILSSDGVKLVAMHYLQPVSAEDSRKAWRHFLEENCRNGCQLDPGAVDRFAGMIVDMAPGDTQQFLFTGEGVRLVLNGEPQGSIEDAAFARTLLATWIGEVPTSEEVREGLLEGSPPA